MCGPLCPRLEILRVLTQDGKDIEYMEEAIGERYTFHIHIKESGI